MGVTPALFDFFRELGENNNRTWFEANKARYEQDVRDQLTALMGEGLQVLEHACLIRAQLVLSGTEHWALGWTVTRLGQSAAAQGTVAQALGAA